METNPSTALFTLKQKVASLQKEADDDAEVLKLRKSRNDIIENIRSDHVRCSEMMEAVRDGWIEKVNIFTKNKMELLTLSLKIKFIRP